MCGWVGLTPASTLEELPSSEIGIQSHSKLGTQMSRQISCKYKNPVCGKLDNDVWRWFGVPGWGFAASSPQIPTAISAGQVNSEFKNPT